MSLRSWQQDEEEKCADVRVLEEVEIVLLKDKPALDPFARSEGVAILPLPQPALAVSAPKIFA